MVAHYPIPVRDKAPAQPYNLAFSIASTGHPEMNANFRSDNEAPVAAAIWEALEQSNRGPAHAYAADEWSRKLDAAFSELFGTDVVVLPVATGTVANSIALAAGSPPWGAVFCHRMAHVYCDESGAPEFFGNGLRLVPVDGPDGKIGRDGLTAAIRGAEGHGVHSYAPAALTLTQSTEAGSVYQPEELRSLCEIARTHGMRTHLDGARFANAVAHLGCHPGDVSWRAGIQMLSFGASKNGCMAAEALLFLDGAELLDTAERLRKRSGHLLSKMRYVSAQLLAYIEDGLWLDLAAHANGQAAEFAAAIQRHPEAQLEFPVQANEVFVRWTATDLARIKARGMEFNMWPGQDNLARFVFSHSTRSEETQALIAACSS
jgi:threonine aldolase